MLIGDAEDKNPGNEPILVDPAELDGCGELIQQFSDVMIEIVDRYRSNQHQEGFSIGGVGEDPKLYLHYDTSRAYPDSHIALGVSEISTFLEGSSFLRGNGQLFRGKHIPERRLDIDMIDESVTGLLAEVRIVEDRVEHWKMDVFVSQEKAVLVVSRRGNETCRPVTIKYQPGRVYGEYGFCRDVGVDGLGSGADFISVVDICEMMVNPVRYPPVFSENGLHVSDDPMYSVPDAIRQD